MLPILTVVVFLLVAVGTAALGLQLGGLRSRAMERLAPQRPLVPAVLPSPALIWRDLVSRIGTAMPLPSRDLPRLKRRFVRAGIRSPNAPRYFQGARVVAAAVFGGLALAVGLRAYAETANLVLGVGAAAALGYIAPMQYLMWRVRRRQHASEKGLPNALDLMVICVEAGLGIDQTTLQVAKELQQAHPEISDEFTVMNLELRAGERRHEALHNLAERTGVDDVKKLVAVLVQTDRFGTSIAQSLRGHADYLRSMARQRAEERASKLAVKLVFPIFFCVLPTLFVVTVGPVMTHLVRDLLPFIENM
ncbi:MAG TPA: type II secretion system F family protein [Candidatus Sulfopaludibacter sp.]|nr:type II secretion system F family protein [Candidatus Sulfopaludibacter sp.]